MTGDLNDSMMAVPSEDSELQLNDIHKDFSPSRHRGYERHEFSAEILARVRKCKETDNFHGPRELLEDWAVIAASVFGSLLAWQYADAWVAVPTYLCAIFMIGGRQRALADILHQAAHRTLANNRNLNHFLGTFCSGYLIFQSFSGYQSSHVKNHHGLFAHSTLDPDYLHYQRCGICGPNRTPKAVRNYIVNLFTLRSIFGYLRYLVAHRILPSDERSGERVIRFMFLGAIIGAFFVSGLWPFLLAYWIVPLITTQAWIGAVIELMEHYPMIEGEKRIDIFMSRNRNCSRISNFLLGLQQYEGYHTIHHKFPFIPPWRNEEVHRICMEDPVYRSLNQKNGWLPILREVLRAGQPVAA
jgi:fatty acid desaturase